MMRTFGPGRYDVVDHGTSMSSTSRQSVSGGGVAMKPPGEASG